MTIRPSSPQNQPPLPDRRPLRTAVARVIDDRRRKRLIIYLLGFGVLAVAGLIASTANGQPAYERVPMIKPFADPKSGPKLVRTMQSQVKSFAEGREYDAKYVKAYFQRYLPAILTSDAYLSESSKLVREFHVLLEKSKYNKNRQLFNRYVLEFIRPIAVGNYPPRGRINAIHALANLDSKPADRRASQPPVPEPRVLPELVKLYRKTDNSDGVRAAALHGIHRHVNYGFAGLSPQLKGGLATIMNQILDEPIPAGRSPRAHAYLQGFAVDILEKLRPQGDSSLGEKLVSISTEQSRPDLIALRSAAGIGPIGSDLKDKVGDATKVLDSWSRRALAVMEGEFDRLKSLDRDEPAAGQPPTPGDGVASTNQPTGSDRPRRPSMNNAFNDANSGGARRGSSSSGFSDDEPTRGENAFGDGFDTREDRRGRSRGTVRRKDPVPGENQPPQVVASRRKLNHALEQLKIGVTGSGKPGMPSQPTGGLYAAAIDAKPQVEQWVSMMQDIFEELNSEYLESREDFMETLESQIEALRETLGDESVEPAAEPKSEPADAGSQPEETVAEPEVAVDPTPERDTVAGS